jgi:LmbE family N-acetylglucosaminyl deacetylase
MKNIARRLLRTAITFMMRLRSEPYRLEASSRCLILAPHQDDEAFGCAALILTRRKLDLPVNIIYLTDGAGSHPNHPQLSPANLAVLRRAEATQAMQGLQVEATDLKFLDAPDGTLAHLSTPAFEALARQLATSITADAPTELFLPCREDGSSEHAAAHQIAQRALQLTPLRPRIFEYPIWARWSSQRLLRPLWTSRVWRLHSPPSRAQKRAALACYRSQIVPTPPWPKAVLPTGFAEVFYSDEEFFFEL